MESKVTSYSGVKNTVWAILDLLKTTKHLDNYHVIAFLLFLKSENIADKIVWRLESDNSISILDAINRTISDFHSQINGDIARTLADSFSRELSGMDKFVIIEIFDLLSLIDNELYQDYSAEIIDDVLIEIAKRTSKRGGNYIQPKEITQIIDSLVELPGNAYIYNPFAGLASFGVGLKTNVNYFGQEINQNIWALGIIRLLAHKVNIDNYRCEDSIINWKESYQISSIFSKGGEQKGKFDLVISTPPFALRIDPMAQFGKYKIARTSEEFITINGLDSIKPDGKLVLVTSTGFLNQGGGSFDVRKSLIENDFLEMVILLPNGLFDAAGVSTSILIINKNKRGKGIVKVVNGESFYIQDRFRKTLMVDKLLEIIKSDTESEFATSIPIALISENNNNFNPNRYLIQEQIIPSEYTAFELRQLLTPIPRNSGNNGSMGKYIQIGDLANDPFDYETSFTDKEESELNKNATKLSADALLVSRISLRLKPTYFIWDREKPVYINPNIWAFTVSQEIIDIAYLVNELYSDFLQKQLVSFSSGGVISSISQNEFSKIKILVPSIQVQKELIADARKKIIITKEQELKALKGKFEQQTFEEFASLKHALGKPIPGITTAMEYIFEYLQKNEGKIISLDAKVSNRRDITLRDKFNVVFNSLKLIQTLLKKGDNGFVLEQYPLQSCKVVPLVKEFINSYSTDKFSIKVYDENNTIEDIEILGNNDLITILLNDILSNANNHAFVDYDSEKNEVVIFLSIMSNNLHLIIANNGLPFPTNFDHEKFIQKYQKAGDSAGAGIGGYDINRIALYLNGTFHLITEPLDGFSTLYQFIFPLLNAKADELE